jgi:hypothetical protein
MALIAVFGLAIALGLLGIYIALGLNLGWWDQSPDADLTIEGW